MIEYDGEVEYEVRPYHLTRAYKGGKKAQNRKTIIAPELKKLDETIFSRRGGGYRKFGGCLPIDIPDCHFSF